MRRVYKYTIPIELFNARGIIELPRGAQVLSVGEQADALVMWVLVDPSEPKEDRWFVVVGTGHDADTPHPGCTRKFIGTVQMRSDTTPYAEVVLHVFEEVRV